MRNVSSIASAARPASRLAGEDVGGVGDAVGVALFGEEAPAVGGVVADPARAS